MHTSLLDVLSGCHWQGATQSWGCHHQGQGQLLNEENGGEGSNSSRHLFLCLACIFWSTLGLEIKLDTLVFCPRCLQWSLAHSWANWIFAFVLFAAVVIPKHYAHHSKISYNNIFSICLKTGNLNLLDKTCIAGISWHQKGTTKGGGIFLHLQWYRGIHFTMKKGVHWKPLKEQQSTLSKQKSVGEKVLKTN